VSLTTQNPIYNTKNAFSSISRGPEEVWHTFLPRRFPEAAHGQRRLHLFAISQDGRQSE